MGQQSKFRIKQVCDSLSAIDLRCLWPQISNLNLDRVIVHIIKFIIYHWLVIIFSWIWQNSRFTYVESWFSNQRWRVCQPCCNFVFFGYQYHYLYQRLSFWKAKPPFLVTLSYLATPLSYLAKPFFYSVKQLIITKVLQLFRWNLEFLYISF